MLLASPAQAAVGDIHIPFVASSKYAIKGEAGPPSSKSGINRYAPTNVLNLSAGKYDRQVSFSKDGRYIIFENFYMGERLSSFQVVELQNYIDYRVAAGFTESWEKDLQGQLGKEAGEGGDAAVQIDIPWEPPAIVKGIIGEGKSKGVDVLLTYTSKPYAAWLSYSLGRSDYSFDRILRGTPFPSQNTIK